MAKFCGNCGAQMEDNAKVCGKCGAPFEASARPENGNIGNSEKNKAARKKIIKLCLGLAALILVAVIAINLITSFTGYNGLLRKVMAAYKNYDIDTLVEMSSDMYYFGSENLAEIYFEGAVGYALDSFDSSVGHNYKLSYEVDDVYKLSKRNLESVLDDITWQYSEFDISVIEEVVVADITVTARQGSRIDSREVKVTLSKENGTWKLMYIE